MSGRSPSRRLQPSASAPSLPLSKRAGVRPSESHFNPTLSTLSHFPSHFAARIPRNPAESRRIRRPSVLCPVSRDNPTSGPVQWPRRGALAPAQRGGPHDTPRETVAIQSGRKGHWFTILTVSIGLTVEARKFKTNPISRNPLPRIVNWNAPSWRLPRGMRRRRPEDESDQPARNARKRRATSWGAIVGRPSLAREPGATSAWINTGLGPSPRTASNARTKPASLSQRTLSA